MLVALADFFQVTTDALLGREKKPDQAIILAETEELGQKIAALIKTYNIQTNVILTDPDAALAVAAYEEEHGKNVKFFFDVTHASEHEYELEEPNSIIHIHVRVDNWTDENVLSAVELYLRNMDAINSIRDK